MNHTNKRPLIASLVLGAVVSTFFAGCYYDRDADRGYHRYSRDYGYYDRDRYYDRDWRRDRYRSHDYRDDHDRYSSNPIDPFRNHYND